MLRGRHPRVDEDFVFDVVGCEELHPRVLEVLPFGVSEACDRGLLVLLDRLCLLPTHGRPEVHRLEHAADDLLALLAVGHRVLDWLRRLLHPPLDVRKVGQGRGAAWI